MSPRLFLFSFLILLLSPVLVGETNGEMIDSPMTETDIRQYSVPVVEDDWSPGDNIKEGWDDVTGALSKIYDATVGSIINWLEENLWDIIVDGVWYVIQEAWFTLLGGITWILHQLESAVTGMWDYLIPGEEEFYQYGTLGITLNLLMALAILWMVFLSIRFYTYALDVIPII